MNEPDCYIVVEVVGPTIWIEDGPFTKQEAIDLAAKHTEQMADLTGGHYRADAVHLLAEDPDRDQEDIAASIAGDTPWDREHENRSTK